MSKFTSKKETKGLVVDVDKAKFVDTDADKAAKTKKATKAPFDGGKKAEKKAEKPATKKVAEKADKSDDRKITLVTKENPKRAGSASFERFELYKKAKTVADYVAAGGTTADIRFDEKAGHIKLA